MAQRTTSRGRGTRPTPRRVPEATIRRRRYAALAVLGAVVVVVAIVAAIPGKVDHAIEEVILPLRHDDIIRQQAKEKDVDASLIAAVIYAESRFSDQTSSAGARGLMQVTPQAALDIAKKSGATTFKLSDLGDPQINISYGTYLLRDLLNRYDGNPVAALAAYNAGPGNADKWGGASMEVDDIRFPETRAYVDTVLEKRTEYRDKYARELGY